MNYNKLFDLGTKVQCSEFHKGTLVSYFPATDQFTGDLTLYGVIQLDEGYWTEGRKTFIALLVVHHDNLEAI